MKKKRINIKFKPKRWYNEFTTWIRWKDYFSFYILDFPIISIRKYDFLDIESSTFLIGLFGLSISIYDVNIMEKKEWKK